MKLRHIIAISVVLTVAGLLFSGCFSLQETTSEVNQYATVTFRNVTGMTIFYLYISERSNNYWGSDWLGSSNVLSNNNTYTTRLLTGEYDVLATDLSGDIKYTFWITVRPGGGTWSIEPSDRR